MCIAHSSSIHASVASHQMSALGGPQVNKFEQMSQVGGSCTEEGGGLRPGSGRSLYGEVQCIMRNGHMGSPMERQTDRHIGLKSSLQLRSRDGKNLDQSVPGITMRTRKKSHFLPSVLMIFIIVLLKSITGCER